jgi:hypothetical protein
LASRATQQSPPHAQRAGGCQSYGHPSHDELGVHSEPATSERLTHLLEICRRGNNKVVIIIYLCL